MLVNGGPGFWLKVSCLVHIMTWSQIGSKPLYEPIMVFNSLLSLHCDSYVPMWWLCLSRLIPFSSSAAITAIAMLNCILAYMSRCSSKANWRCCGGLAMIASNALYKIFTLYIPKAHEQIHVPDIVRQSSGSPAASCRWSPDDPTMCSPS